LFALPPNERMERVAFNPVDPAVMATAGREGMVRVWDLRTGKMLVALLHPGWAGDGLEFSPDGTELLTGCDMVRVWDWRAGTLQSASPFQVNAFSLTADQRWLVMVRLGTLLLSDWQTKSLAGPIWKLKGATNFALALPAGDRRAIVGGFSHSLVAYDLETMV